MCSADQTVQADTIEFQVCSGCENHSYNTVMTKDLKCTVSMSCHFGEVICYIYNKSLGILLCVVLVGESEMSENANMEK